MYVVFDIDGVLADPGHRLHHILDEDKDWDAFFADAVADPAIPEMVTLYQALADAGHRIILNTGRSSQIRELTEQWLAEESLDYDALLMRPEGDRRPDSIVKIESFYLWLREHYVSTEEILFIVEDRRSVVDEWRRLGFRVLHNAEGEF